MPSAPVTAVAAGTWTLADLGVARVSFGPWTHWVALTALADVGAALLAGTGAIPPDTRMVG